MSNAKRPASTLSSGKARKRTRNGVTYSRAPLDFDETPLDSNNGMLVWNANAHNYRNSWLLVIPLPPEESNDQLEDVLEEAENVFAESTAGDGERKKKREKKRVNDSVSLPDTRSYWGPTCFYRQKCWISFACLPASSTKSYDGMVFKKIRHLPSVTIVKLTEACTDVWTAPPPTYTVPLALFPAMGNFHCTELRCAPVLLPFLHYLMIV